MARDEEAMSAERLAAIREKLAPGYLSWLDEAGIIPVHVVAARELLAEVERLRAREAALLAEREQAMEIVRAVANQDCAQDIDDPEWMQCLACGGGGPTGESIEHLDICYYIAARALLASTAERSGGDERR